MEWEDWDKPLRRAILAIVLCPPMQSGAALGGSSSERKQSPVEERAGVGGGGHRREVSAVFLVLYPFCAHLTAPGNLPPNLCFSGC